MIRFDDVIRAALELGIARARIGIEADKAKASTKLSAREDRIVERITYAVPRVAARVPWRADCLVQAMAAKRWLSARGIGSTIHYGVPRQKGERFEAHAWLTVGERLVTGGDISGFVPLKRQSLLTDAS